MPRRLIRGNTWVDTFVEGTFGGRIYRLKRGERTPLNKVGSLIIGPRAVGQVVSRTGQELLKLPPGKIVKDTSELPFMKSNAYLRVAAARA
jgi:hypothetical protein